MNLTEKEKMLVETCLRMTLVGLMNREEETQMDFEGILHNINVGGFGERDYKFETISWLAELEDLRKILMKISPEYQDNNDTGSWYRLPEEKTNGSESMEEEKGCEP